MCGVVRAAAKAAFFVGSTDNGGLNEYLKQRVSHIRFGASFSLGYFARSIQVHELLSKKT